MIKVATEKKSSNQVNLEHQGSDKKCRKGGIAVFIALYFIPNKLFSPKNSPGFLKCRGCFPLRRCWCFSPTTYPAASSAYVVGDNTNDGRKT